MSARDAFADLTAAAEAALTGDEILVSSLAGESSDFVRFNGAAVRQAGSVIQQTLSLDLTAGRRHTLGSLTLSGDVDVDRPRVVELVAELRAQRDFVPDDPYLLIAHDQPSIEAVDRPALPDSATTIDAVLDSAAGKDLVGIYAAGTTFAGVSVSTGIHHWYEGGSFNLDWSFYLGGDGANRDKAAKNLYAGTTWDDAAFARKIAWSEQQLAALARTPIDLEPGRYRAYLAPAAMAELLGILSWGAFGLKAHETKTTPFLQMVTEGRTLSPEIRLREDIAGGTAPPFQSHGFARPDQVSLIHDGIYSGHLVSPRSAQEYAVPTNGANDWEAPVALAMEPGTIPADDIVEHLDTGIYIGNLWYLNYSDRAACRTTGMTRFATFWVRDGEVVAPINVLRYDDTAYSMLGDHLVGLTDTAETMLDPATYEARSTDSQRLPGALIDEMTFTL